MTIFSRKVIAIALGLLVPTIATQGLADEKDESYHQDFIYGVPAEPTEAWIMSRGGRLYDNWITALDADEPDNTHPLWPSTNSKTGATTYRCKSCHGWDYRGADGKYGGGSYLTGIKGVMGASDKTVEEITAIIRNSLHGFTTDMIPEDQMEFLSAFVSRGVEDMNALIDFETGHVSGDAGRGESIFQTTCAACHGFDGTALDWGDGDDHAYIGTEANANPWEVFHKIRNGHPGVEMISLRAFERDDATNVLAYVRTLPQE